MAEIEIKISDLPLNGAKDQSAKLVVFSGQLDESNVDEKSKEIYELIEKSANKTSLVFDFGGLEYMNSKAIGYLIDWHLKVTEKGGKIILVSCRENIIDILNIVGLTQIVDHLGTVDEAAQAIING